MPHNQRQHSSAVSLLLFGLLAFAMCTVAVSHADAAQKRVVWADPARSHWTTDLAIDGHPTHTSAIALSNCLVSRGVLVPPYGAAIVANFGAALCGGPIGLLDVGNVDASLTTIARYRGAGVAMTLSLPALDGQGIVTAQDEFRAGPIANSEGADVTHVLLFNEGAADGDVTLLVYDGVGTLLAREFVRVSARSALFYRLQAPVTVGSLRLRGGIAWGGGPSGTIQPTFAYAVVGPVDGAVAPRVVPFVPVIREQP